MKFLVIACILLSFNLLNAAPANDRQKQYDEILKQLNELSNQFNLDDLIKAKDLIQAAKDINAKLSGSKRQISIQEALQTAANEFARQLAAQLANGVVQNLNGIYGKRDLTVDEQQVLEIVNRVDWDKVGQDAVENLLKALPNIFIALVGRRDANDAVDLGQIANDLLKKLLEALPSLLGNIVGKRSEYNIDLDRTLQVAADELARQLAAQTAQRIKEGLDNLFGKRDVAEQEVMEIVSRVDWDKVAQEAINAAIKTLPSLIGALVGKREIISNEEFVEIASRLEWDDMWKSLISAAPGLAVALIPLLGRREIENQDEIVEILSRLDINWDKVGQQILDGAVQAIPIVLPSLIAGLFGKRDVDEQAIMEIASRIDWDDVLKGIISAAPGVVVALIPLLG